MDEKDKLLDILQKDITTMLEKRVGDDEECMIAAAVLLKTAIQLYTCVLNDDGIEHVFSVALDSIPQLRDTVTKFDKPTIHQEKIMKLKVRRLDKTIEGNWKLCKEIVFEYDKINPFEHNQIIEDTARQLSKKYNVDYNDVVKNIELLF